MNGAESLVRTLVAGGIDTCFCNPGTSEMHFLAALDRVEGMRCVLGLCEAVLTGAADGYARMSGKPAATLLHLGPGLANSLSNLHNARRAFSPIVNIVGDHATYHRAYDAPLTSDIEGIARPLSDWVRTSPSARKVAEDGAAAIVAARTPPGGIATLILPADTAWTEGSGIATLPPLPERPPASASAIDACARILRSGEPATLILAGAGLRADALAVAGRIAAATGARLNASFACARLERGAGRVPVERIPYRIAPAIEHLKGFRQVILVAAKAPVAFFAYPDQPGVLTPPDCAITQLCGPDADILGALEALAEAVGAPRHAPPVEPLARPARPTGALEIATIGLALGALLPEDAIVVDEAGTSGFGFGPATKGAPPHDWLQNTGGSIGMGLPLATGAAIACPDRRVICLEGDGSGMYTLQALWTQAREGLSVTTLIFANRSYAILRQERANVGACNAGPKALDMLDLGRPDLDWVAMARGMGVPGARVERLDALLNHLERGIRTAGPYLVEIAI
jgi:acetolactate synthase-1/2/3 large subunit